MSDTVEQIKSRLDIVDVISGYLKLQKAGANFKARCPFHNEKTPSFHISPERQSWHCFGCNKGGDMFSFVQEIDGLEFMEALRILAAKAGVTVPTLRAHTPEAQDAKGPLRAVVELSAKFFEKQLWNSNAGAKALEYLRGRGLTDQTIKAWRIGWAPNDWRALTSFLSEQGHMPSAIVSAGMAIDKQGRPYDRFRSRIMFPIADMNGQIAGFTGRVFGAQVTVDGGEPAKYVNTPQTVIYDKSNILFGLDKAKLDMRQRNECLLVEGNMDAIMAWQAGSTNVVATSGTALTPAQLKQLARYSMNLSFCFDTDQAGQTATRRGIGLALAQNFSIKVLTIEDQECKDPADYVAKYGARFNDLVTSAKPVLQYYFDMALATYDPASVASKKTVIAAMGPLVKRLTSRVEQDHWIAQLAAVLRTEPRNVQADITAVHDDIAAYERSSEAAAATGAPSAPIPPLGLDAYNEELLCLLMKSPELRTTACSLAPEMLDPRLAVLIGDPDLLAATADHEYRHIVDVASMRAHELWSEWSPDQLQAEFVLVTARLRIRHLRTLNAQLTRDIEQAELHKDRERRDTLIHQFQNNTYELNQLLTSTTS